MNRLFFSSIVAACLITGSAAAQQSAPPSEIYEPREGDVLVFSSNSSPIRTVIGFATKSDVTHVAPVVRGIDGELVLLDADIRGVQLVDARRCVNEYWGRVAVRRLKNPLTPAESLSMAEFARQQVGKKYTPLRELRQLAKLATGPAANILKGNNIDNIFEQRRWHCSEITASAFQAAGRMDAAVDSRLVMPADFFRRWVNDPWMDPVFLK